VLLLGKGVVTEIQNQAQENTHMWKRIKIEGRSAKVRGKKSLLGLIKRTKDSGSARKVRRRGGRRGSRQGECETVHE